MSGPPPRARLLRVLRALAEALPEQMEGLLEAPRFADGREALARLGDRAHAARAVEAMTDDEAAALADRLQARWQRIAVPVESKDAAIVAPAEIWIEDEPVRFEVEVVAEGVDDDWEAVWDGPVEPGPPSRRAAVTAQPGAGSVVVRAHVRARARGERCILLAEATIAVRRGKPPLQG